MNLKDIKDAARKAFSNQQSQDTEGGVPDAVSFIAGFVEGARYRQDEINELTNILDFKKETIVEMQNAYETLQAHDEMLIATVDKLKEENKKLRDGLEDFILEDVHMVDCRYTRYGSEYDCKCMDRNYYNRDSVMDRARQVLKEIGEE